MTALLSLDLLAEALFVSHLQPSEHPSTALVRAETFASGFQHGEVGCAALVAQEYGEHPDCACKRMQWARTAVHEAFSE